MPTSSSSSSVHLTPYSRRRSPRVSAAAAAAAACQGGEQPGKAAAIESSPANGVSSSMGPQQDPSKDVPNGPAAPKKEKVVVRYRECRKNHAASIGGYAVDGCREFMASGEEGTSAALKCAACSCHRSFHKREVESEVPCDCSSDSTSSGR